MKIAAGVLMVLLVPHAAPRPPAALPAPPGALAPAGQEWLGEPVLPEIFRDGEPGPAAAPDPSSSPLDLPDVLGHSSAGVQEAPPRSEIPSPGSEFPRGVGAPEIEAWRRSDELRRIREWASDATLGAPLLVPQLILESFLPRGMAVGPTTFLYRTSSPSSSLSLVVFDQVLFHEAQFFGQAQERSDAAYALNLPAVERRVLRRSLSSGFRASYAIPGVTLDQMIQTADEQGALGYALLPPVAGALLCLKGIDQRVELGDELRVRVRLASGHTILKDLHSENGNPCVSIDLRLRQFPVGVIASFDLSKQGMAPAFVGLGTTLDAVEELVAREAFGKVPPVER
jgi:hypothetical protein